jgi:hypothetical protein
MEDKVVSTPEVVVVSTPSQQFLRSSTDRHDVDKKRRKKGARI